MWLREIVRSAEVVFLLNSKNRNYRGRRPAWRQAVRQSAQSGQQGEQTDWLVPGPGLLIGADRPARPWQLECGPGPAAAGSQGHPFKFRRQSDPLVRACRVNRLTGWSLSDTAHWVRAY